MSLIIPDEEDYSINEMMNGGPDLTLRKSEYTYCH